MAKTRSDIHQEMYAAFMAMGTLAEGIKAAVVKGTGTGKSYDGIAIASDVIAHEKPTHEPKVLLLSNSTRLRDVTWLAEFKLWGKEELLQYCTRLCYQSAMNLEGTHWDLVIADEGDFALTEKYSQFFFNNTYKNLLLMTGYVAERKKELLKKIAPICFTYTTQQAQDDGVLNKTQFKFVRYMLNSKDKYIPVEYIKNKQKFVFYQTENDAYNYLQTRYVETVRAFSVAQSKWQVAVLGNKPSGEVLKLETAKNFAEKKMLMAVNRRKMFLWTTMSGRVATKRLLQQILVKDESTKVLVFAKLTDEIDKMLQHTYHSKNAGTKAEPNLNIELLNESEIRYLGVCDAINRGENLIGVDHIIKHSYTGSPTDFQQQHGRGVRLSADQTMHMFIMIPYYNKRIDTIDPKTKKRISTKWEVAPTQAEKWAYEMVEGFDLSTAKTFNLT